MGLRPSVKGDSHDIYQNRTTTSTSPTNCEGDCNSSSSPSPSSSSTPAKSTPPASSTPQREAWTARGQLLLNFHHAISKAINSPEMARKCSRIAEDMSRSEGEEEEGPAKRQVQPASPSNSKASPETASATLASRPTAHTLAEEYGAEAAMIVENKSKRDAIVRSKTMAVGLFAFVTLRAGRGASAWIRKSIASGHSPASSFGRSYQFDKLPGAKTATFTSGKRIESTSSRSVEMNQPSTPRRIFRVTLDLAISTSVALLSGTFLFMPRPSAYIEDMAKLPLVEGKSIYAEMVCPPLLKEYRRVLEEYGGRWPVNMGSNTGSNATEKEGDERQLTQEDVSLNVIRTFVENCSKRSKYERALLEERNALSLDTNQTLAVSRLMRRITRSKKPESSSGTRQHDTKDKLGTVSVPSPGVPGDIAVDLDCDVYSLEDDVSERERERDEGEQQRGDEV